MTIAHLEQSRLYQSIVRRVVNGEGHDYQGFVSTTELYEVIESTHYDIIITSLQHRELSGLVLVKNIMEKSPNTPIIVVSATESDAKKEMILALGAYAFVIKGQNIKKELLDVLRKIQIQIG